MYTVVTGFNNVTSFAGFAVFETNSPAMNDKSMNAQSEQFSSEEQIACVVTGRPTRYAYKSGFRHTYEFAVVGFSLTLWILG